MQNPCTRREFLKAAAASGTALALNACSHTKISSYKRIIGANDRISIGIIGCGQRGTNSHIPGIHEYA